MHTFCSLMLVGRNPAKYNDVLLPTHRRLQSLNPKWEVHVLAQGCHAEALKSLSRGLRVDVVYFDPREDLAPEVVSEQASALGGAMARHSNKPWIALPTRYLKEGADELYTLFEKSGVTARSYPLTDIILMRAERK